MRKKIIPVRKNHFVFSLLFLFGFFFSYSQNYNMGNGTINACGGNFYDPGGSSGNYADNSNFTQTICSTTGQPIYISFSSFQIESGFDHLTIYNGPSTASPVLGTWTGTTSPGSVQGTGTCITIVFTSDGSVNYFGWTAVIGCGTAPPPPPPPPQQYNTDCANLSNPFCTGTTYTFNNNTGVPSYGGGGVFSCLGSTPNPVWYYLQIANSGPINISINQGTTAGAGNLDVDFCLWGPFTSVASGCPILSASNVVSCSYSGSATETASIPNGVTGQFYILLLTNFSNQSGVIQFSQTSGSGSTNCNILCNITSMTSVPGACNPANSTFSSSGTVNTYAPPTSGTLTISSSCGGTPVVLNPPFATAINYTVTNIPATGGPCQITASYSADPTCTFTVNITSPPPCGGCTATASNTGPYCAGSTIQLNSTGGGTYSWSGPGGFTSTLQNPTRAGATTAMSGVYTVTVTSGSATCTATTNVTVNALPAPTASNTGAYCAGSTIQLNATGGGTYSWSGPGGFTSTVQNPTRPGATIAMGGVYTVTVTVGTCTATATTTVVVNPVPAPTAANTGPYCAGATIQLNGTGGGTYSWSGPGGFTSALQNPTIAASTTAMSGVYTLTVTASGCTATATTNVTVNANPAPTAANTGPYCPGTTISLSSTGGGTYSWSGPNSFTSTLQNPTIPTASTAMSGVYTVTVTVGTCTGTATTNVTVNPSPVPSASNTGPYCPNATIQLNGTGGGTYNWNGPGGFTSTLQNPTIANATTAMSGVYSLTVTAGTCTATVTTNVLVNSSLVPNVAATTPLCAGDVLNLFCTNGISWSWTGPGGYTSTVQNPVISPATVADAGTYSVTATDASGCSGTASVAVVVNPLPNVTVNSPSICIGATANLTANGASSYSWTGGTTPTTGQNVTASPSSTSNYVVTGTDANGCVNTATATVTVNPLPVVVVNSPAVCPGGTANLVAGGAVNYVWTGGTTPTTGANVSVTPASTSAYTVTGTDGNGCVDSAVSTVTVNSALVISAGADATVCNAAGFVLDATGPAGTNYTWNPGNLSGATQNMTASSTTTFVVSGVDANGCTGSDSVVITVPPVITLATGGFPTTCSGVCNGQVVVLASPNTGPFAFYGYLWSNGATTATINNLCAGTYSVTVTDAAGCTATDSAIVTQPTSVTAAASNITPASCNAVCDGSVLITPNGGTPPYNYGWTPLASGNNPTTLCAANYTCTVADANGCTAVVNFTITEPTAITASITPVAPLCIGQTANLSSVPGGGNGGYVYTWTGGTTPTNTQNVTASPTVTTIYTVSITDANGCAPAVASVTVTVTPPLSVVASNDVTICSGASQNMSATANGGNGTYTYTWQGGTTPTTGQNVSATPTVTTTYTVTVTDGCGTPPANDQVIITVNPLPVLNVSVTNASGCQPVCADFVLNSVPGAAMSSWTFTDGQTATNDSTPTICFPNAGSYGATVNVTDINGCVNSYTGNNLVSVYPMPTAAFTFGPKPATELDPIIQFTDSSYGASISSWLWEFNDPGDSSSALQNPVFVFPSAGTFDVVLTVTTPNGCMDTVVHPVVIDPDFVIFVPNAFSPNEDGLNDIFLPKGTGINVDKYEMWVYDRWGNMIFTTIDWSKGWDGKVQGSSTFVQQDVYVWKIKLKTFDGIQKSYVGHVTVVK